MNTEKFTGKAQAYAKARPGYPEEAIEYICSLVPPNPVFADVGAGTGKFTELLAARGYTVFAVEPTGDMREQLAITLAPFPNAKVVNGTAEATTLPDHSVDIITCAQALGWFDQNAFRTECRRIGKPGAIVVSIYNDTQGNSSDSKVGHLTSKQASNEFFKNPAVREFPNPIIYTREKWIAYRSSHSYSPLQSDLSYDAYIAEMNAVFDRENVDGLLRIDMVTMVYSEEIMNIEIKPLTAELAADYFDFFDNRAFSDNSPEGPCYCTRFQMTKAEEKAAINDQIEAYGGWEKGLVRIIRQLAEQQIASGVLRGYLAFADGVSIGWCNVNDKANFPEESGNGARFHAPKENREKVVACFEIAPDFRGKGVATALLQRVIDDAKNEGYLAVEGYPHKRDERYEWDFTGPMRLYERTGFVEVGRQGDRVVMRRWLDGGKNT